MPKNKKNDLPRTHADTKKKAEEARAKTAALLHARQEAKNDLKTGQTPSSKWKHLMDSELMQEMGDE